MVPSRPSTPVGGAQSVSSSLLRTNSGILGGQNCTVGSQSTFPFVPQRSQYSNMLRNVSNVFSLLNQTSDNGGSNMALSTSGSIQHGAVDMGVDSEPFSSIGNGIGFSPSGSFSSSNTINPRTPHQSQYSGASGNQMEQDPQLSQSIESQNFHQGQNAMQQFSIPSQQQQQYQSVRSGLGPVKLESLIPTEQSGLQSPQSIQNLGPIKLEPQQIQSLRSLAPVKMEPQQSDQSLLLQQLMMSRQPSQASMAAQMNLLQQQHLLQMQQQQQILKNLPQSQSHFSQKFQPNMPTRPVKPTIYEAGMCARRLTQYMCHQQRRPQDNNIEFWRKFVSEYFAPHAKKRWCVSLYGSVRQTTGVFPQEVWHCEICNHKPGRGFETTVEVLPRLCKITYDSGTIDELLYVDMPREYQNAAGQIVLDYAKAIQESVFEQLRVVREGQLRVVFSSDLKICSWEFCARRHEELIPRRLLIPQVSQLGAVAQKYQVTTQSASQNPSTQDLQNNCSMFVASARQLAKALEVPLPNDLGYTKRYVRCLQISEVVNSMKDLIDYSRETGTGPIESLINFPRRISTSSVHQNQVHQSDEHPVAQNSTNNETSGVQLMAANSGVVSVNNSLNSSTNSASTSTIAGLIHQNSFSSRQENLSSNMSNPYGTIPMQIPSAGSSSSLPQTQPTPSSPFSTTPTSTNPVPNNTTTNISPSNAQPTQSDDLDANDAQSSVQQIMQEIMMSTQMNSGAGIGSSGTDVKNINRTTLTSTGNSIMNGGGIGHMGIGIGPSPISTGMRGSMSMNGRVGVLSSMSQDSSMNHHQDLGNRIVSGLNAVDNFNNLQFDWKSSP